MGSLRGFSGQRHSFLLSRQVWPIEGHVVLEGFWGLDPLFHVEPQTNGLPKWHGSVLIRKLFSSPITLFGEKILSGGAMRQHHFRKGFFHSAFLGGTQVTWPDLPLSVTAYLFRREAPVLPVPFYRYKTRELIKTLPPFLFLWLMDIQPLLQGLI